MAYTAPTAADLRARFPGKFASPGVSDDQIIYALGRAARQVDTSWPEGDYAEGQMLYGAAFLTSQGLGVLPAGTAEQLAGIKSVKSGALSVEFAGAGEGASASADPALSTLYGRQFITLRRLNRSGPLVTDGGCLPSGAGRAILGRIPEGI